MYVNGIGTAGFALILTAVVTLSQHHRKVAHGRFPFLRYRIRLGRKRKTVLTLGVGQSLGQVGHGVVQRQTAHGQLWLFGLILLILSGTFLGAPLILLLLVHLVQSLQLAHPSLHHRVDTTLATGKVAGYVRNQVQSTLGAVHIQLHARSQRTDTRADGRYNRHRQSCTHGIYRVLHSLRKLRDF